MSQARKEVKGDESRAIDLAFRCLTMWPNRPLLQAVSPDSQFGGNVGGT
ncbi:hypothetical protein BH09BAC3_BH09BAC3_15210 [soil metagenome]